MAYQYDPYDPDEIRRRQLLASSQDSAGPPQLSNIMQPDEEDFAPQQPNEQYSPGGVSSQGKAANVSTLTPAQQRFKDTLSQMPQKADYQPSRWRRFGAAVAGGAAGLRDPAQGVKIAQGI